MFGHKKEKKADRPAVAPGGDKLGVYVHIPFCKSKCDYCDFYSLAGREEQMDRYQKARLPSPRCRWTPSISAAAPPACTGRSG